MATITAPAVLPRRPLGATGLSVSVLGFGASPLGSVFEAIDEEEGVRAVHEAVRQGINFFDVSPFYGQTRAETVLGRALRALPRDQFILSTKVGRYGQSDFDYSAARVTRSVEESMARLGVTYIDVVQCHDVEFVPLDQVVREALPALAALKAAGKIGFVGITGLPLAHLQRVLSAAPPGSVDVVLSYCKLSLADSTLLGVAGALRGPGGRGLISASPLCMGLLTAAGPPAWHPAPQSLRTAAAAASAACEAAGRLIAPLALQWAVRRSEVDCTLVGMSTVAQVTANCESVRAALQPGWEAEATAALAAAQACLAPHVDMDWPSGLPENE